MELSNAMVGGWAVARASIDLKRKYSWRYVLGYTVNVSSIRITHL